MVASVPQIPKIVTLTIATIDFAPDAIDAEIVPAPGDIKKVTTLDGVVHQDTDAEAWALKINMVLDWDSVRPGLAYYLYTHKGETVAFVLNVYGTGAESATQPKMTGTCKLVPV